MEAKRSFTSSEPFTAATVTAPLLSSTVRLPSAPFTSTVPNELMSFAAPVAQFQLAMAVFHIGPAANAAHLNVAEIIAQPDFCIVRDRDVVINGIGRPSLFDADEPLALILIDGAYLDALSILRDFNLDFIRLAIRVGLGFCLRADGRGDLHIAAAFAMNVHITKFIFHRDRLVRGQRERLVKMPRGCLLGGACGQRRHGHRHRSYGHCNRGNTLDSNGTAGGLHGLVSNTSCNVACFSWYIDNS